MPAAWKAWMEAEWGEQPMDGREEAAHFRPGAGSTEAGAGRGEPSQSLVLAGHTQLKKEMWIWHPALQNNAENWVFSLMFLRI